MSTGDSAQVEGHAAELATYWPALAPALARDQGAADTGSVTTSGALLQAPVNLDVLRAAETIRTEAPARAADWASTVGEQPQHRDPDALWPHLPRWHRRMLATNAPRPADDLAATVHRWRNQLKRAVGLLAPDRPLGKHCPLHDDVLAELVAPGAEGWLQPGHHAASLTVTWHEAHLVSCRHCGASWIPARYLFLRRLLRDAAARRATARTSAAAVA